MTLRQTSKLSAFLFCIPLLGQRITSEITGTVTDASNAAVSNAQVLVVNESTKRRLLAQTNNVGTYRVAGLEPGTFEITVDATGFRQEKHIHVVLDVGQILR